MRGDPRPRIGRTPRVSNSWGVAKVVLTIRAGPRPVRCDWNETHAAIGERACARCCQSSKSGREAPCNDCGASCENPAVLLEPQQGRIDRTLVYLEPLAGGLLDPAGQPEPVERPHRVEGLQDEEVEHAVRHVRPRLGHVASLHEHDGSLSCCLSTGKPRGVPDGRSAGAELPRSVSLG